MLGSETGEPKGELKIEDCGEVLPKYHRLDA